MIIIGMLFDTIITVEDIRNIFISPNMKPLDKIAITEPITYIIVSVMWVAGFIHLHLLVLLTVPAGMISLMESLLGSILALIFSICYSIFQFFKKLTDEIINRYYLTMSEITRTVPLTYEEIEAMKKEHNNAEKRELPQSPVVSDAFNEIVNLINICIEGAVKHNNECSIMYIVEDVFEYHNLPGYTSLYTYVFSKFPFMRFEFAPVSSPYNNYIYVDTHNYVVSLPSGFTKYGFCIHR
jgi:hypothetical protein